MPALTHQAIAIIRFDLAHEGRGAHFHRLGNDPHRSAYRCRREVVDRNMRSDALFVLVQVRGQHLPRGNFHVMGHGPCRIHAVDDDTVERWAHVFRDEGGQLSGVADFKGGLHEQAAV